jgi:adenylate cyclase
MTTRRLAAILAADVVGFSSMMERDEEGTLRLIKAAQRDLIEPRVRKHHGRIVKTTGDGFLIEFGSPLDAVRCALEVQEAVSAGGEPGGSEEALRFRMGINLGDIIIEDDGDIYGDGVNVATRLEQIAEPGSICISGKVFDEVEGKLSTSFSFTGEQTVKNLTRPVRVYSTRSPSEPTEAKQLQIPARPSVAVLPFTNMSGDPEQEYFADGIVEELISALSRVRSFFVIARNSSFTYKGRAVDVRVVGRELGVRYILEGSVRKGGNRIRITAQLLDATDGSHLWADHYDGELTDIFDLQDRITESIVGAIEPSIRSSEIERARRKRPDSLDAYDLVMCES